MLSMSCFGSSSVTYSQKNWSPVQVAIIPPGPTNSQGCCSQISLFSFPPFAVFFFFFCKKLLSFSLSYIVHSLQYKVLKCQTKININVTVARIFNKIDPCHSWLKCSVRLNFIWIFFSRDLRSLMFLLLQLISRGKKDGAALLPDTKAGGEWEESGGGEFEMPV